MIDLFRRNPKWTLLGYILIAIATYQMLDVSASVVFLLTGGFILAVTFRKLPFTARMQEVNITPEEADQIARKKMYDSDMPVHSEAMHVPVKKINEVHWRFYYNWLCNGIMKIQMVDVSAVDKSISSFMPVAHIRPRGVMHKSEEFEDKEAKTYRIFKEKTEREARD
jgi:hypothetical protein